MKLNTPRVLNLKPKKRTGSPVEIYYLHPKYEGRDIIASALSKDAGFTSVWICSPYVTPEAFEWLADLLAPRKERTSLYLLTSVSNRYSNPKLIEAAAYWHKHQGDFFVKIHGAAAKTSPSGNDQFIHAKLILFVTQKGEDGVDLDANADVRHAFFGSCNFTGEGIGAGGKRQNCEVMAAAAHPDAKSALKGCFEEFWKFSGSKPARKYCPNVDRGGFVRLQ